MYGRGHTNQSNNTSNSSDKSKETNPGRNRNRRGKDSGDKQSSMGSWAQDAACGAEQFNEPTEAEVNASQPTSKCGNQSKNKDHGNGSKLNKKRNRQTTTQSGDGGEKSLRRTAILTRTRLRSAATSPRSPSKTGGLKSSKRMVCALGVVAMSTGRGNVTPSVRSADEDTMSYFMMTTNSQIGMTKHLTARAML